MQSHCLIEGAQLFQKRLIDLSLLSNIQQYYSLILNNNQMENAKVKQVKNNNKYSYLSIDQVKRQHNTVPDSRRQFRQYLNIHFDTKIINHNNHHTSSFSNNRQIQPGNYGWLHSKSLQQSQIYNHLMKKQKINTKETQLQQVQKLILIDQRVINESVRQSILKNRQSKSKSFIINDDKIKRVKIPSLISINSIGCKEQQFHQTIPLKSKRHFFQNMIKKCDKLKQIYRYQNQLMRIEGIKNDGVIRFNTEPIKQNQQLKVAKFTNKIKQNNLVLGYRRAAIPECSRLKAQTQMKKQDGERKTLQIRKYHNQSMLKQRLKYMAQRKIMKIKLQQLDQSQTKKPKILNIKRTKLAKSMPKQLSDSDYVGPWKLQSFRAQNYQ